MNPGKAQLPRRIDDKRLGATKSVAIARKPGQGGEIEVIGMAM
jgi:hypothetical protein